MNTNEPPWFVLPFSEADRVAALVANADPTVMKTDEAVWMALRFEFDSMLECSKCRRLLWLHGDEVVGSLVRE